MSGTDSEKQAFTVVNAWQNQSYWPIKGWGTPSKNTAPYFNVPSLKYGSDSIPDDIPPPEGWTWVDEWSLDGSTFFGTPDGEGWFYATSFDRLNDSLRNRTAVGIASKTCLVRKRRWLRTATCTSPALIKIIQRRIEIVKQMRNNVESAMKEKEHSIRSVKFYEENRSFVYAQSLHLASQGTQSTMYLLKELIMKAKRFGQFLSERAAVEREYALKIELLGRKYGSERVNNYIHAATGKPTANFDVPSSASASSAAAANNPLLGGSSTTSSSNAGGKLSTALSALSRGARRISTQSIAEDGRGRTISSNSEGISQVKPDTAATTTNPANSPTAISENDDVRTSGTTSPATITNTDSNADPEQQRKQQRRQTQAYERTAAETAHDFDQVSDSKEIVFQAISALTKTSAARQRIFTSTVSNRIVDTLDQMIEQIQIVHREARTTYRKNSDICRLCESSVHDAFETAQLAFAQVQAVAEREFNFLSEELNCMQGSHLTYQEAHILFPLSCINDPAYVDDSSNSNDAMGLHSPIPKSHRLSVAADGSSVAESPEPEEEITDTTAEISNDTTKETEKSSASQAITKSSVAANMSVRAGEDIWVCIQKYRQCVRDSQEALCVFISEHMDLEMHQQILTNKMHSLFVSIGQSFAQEQAALWNDLVTDFAQTINDHMSRMVIIGPPYPVLKSPFAKLQEMAALRNNDNSIEHLDDFDYTKKTLNTAGSGINIGTSTMRQIADDNRARSSSGMVGSQQHIHYEDFALGVGVFSFTSLFREKLPPCPGVLLSGDVKWSKSMHVAGSPSKLQRQSAWQDGYVVATSDCYLHLINRRKCNLPDLSFFLKQCEIRVGTEAAAEASAEEVADDLSRRLLYICPTEESSSSSNRTAPAVMNQARPDDAIYIQLQSEAKCKEWAKVLQEPTAVASFVDEAVERATMEAMLDSMPIIKGETAKVDLHWEDFRNDDDTSAEQPTTSVKPTASTAEEAVSNDRRTDSEDLERDTFGLDIVEGPVDDNIEDDDEGSANEAVPRSRCNEADTAAHTAAYRDYKLRSTSGNSRASINHIPSGGESIDLAEKRKQLRSTNSEFLFENTRDCMDDDESEMLRRGRNQISPTGSESSKRHSQSTYAFGSLYRKDTDQGAWIRLDQLEGSSSASGKLNRSSMSSTTRSIIPPTDRSTPLAKKHSSMILQYEQGLKEEQERLKNVVQQTRNYRIKEVITLQKEEDNKIVPAGSIDASDTADGGASADQHEHKSTTGSSKVKRLGERFISASSISNSNNEAGGSTSPPLNKMKAIKPQLQP